MKLSRRILLPAPVCCAVFFVLSACGGENPPGTAVSSSAAVPPPSAFSSVSPSPVSSPAVPAVSSASPSSAPATGSAESEPPVTDAQIRENYRKAAEAYGWFELTTMPLSGGPAIQYDGEMYQKVNYPGIRTYAQLQAYLHSLFSDSIVAELLDSGGGPPRYRDIDGTLYAIPADRGTDITQGNVTVRILWNSKTKATVQVTVEVLKPETQAVVGYETHNFSYAYSDGKWVFETFSLVR